MLAAAGFARCELCERLLIHLLVGLAEEHEANLVEVRAPSLVAATVVTAMAAALAFG